MKTKNVFYLYILMFLFFLLYFFSNISFAGDPKLINTLNGAFEKIENYIQRLEKLEELPKQFDGVDKVFAIQAGREIRVIVNPEKIDDLKAHKLARDVKEKIETELTYPGHIKVTVIREIRANEIAK